MTTERRELPEGWRWAELAQVVEIGSEQVLPKRHPNELFNYIALENVEQGTGRLIDFAPTGGANIASNKYRFTPAYVLYGKLRPYLQKALIPDFEGVSATDLLPLKPNPQVLDRRFLWRWLLSYDVLEYVTARQTGVKMPRLRTGDLETMPVLLAPLREQHRIVEKIERLFAQSRTARQALERVPALLKRLRQAVLAKAFRGELTERDPGDEPAAVLLERIRAERRRKWEEELRAKGKDPRKAKYVEPEPPDTSELPVLPKGWCWASLGELIALLQYGTSVRADADAIFGFPVLRMGNIQEGQFDFRSLKYIDPTREDIPKYLLQEDDILINRTNSPELVGKAALFDGGGQFVFASYLIRLRVRPAIISPQYLVSVINSEIGRRHVAQVKHQVAGQANINSQNIREMPVPLAPLGQQHCIVAKIESLFAQTDAIKRAVVAARRRAEKVDQAILARAFRGEL